MTPFSKSRLFLLAGFSCLAACGFHLYLLVQHYKMKFGMAAAQSVCNISEAFNCDAVNMSSYSVFIGAPIALWGLIANLLLALLFFRFFLDSSAPHSTQRFALLWSGLILLASVVMGSISSFILGTYCLFCIGAYVMSLITFVIAFIVTPRPFLVPAEWRSLFRFGEQGSASLLIYFLAIPLGSLMINSMIITSYSKDLDILVQESILEWKRNPQVEFDLKQTLEMGASADEAIMTIVEFADFNCIHCKMAAPSLHAFVQSKNKVRFIFQNYPLDGNCNPAIQGPGRSCQSAKATLCAEEQQKGWQVHQWLFDHQGENIADLASQLIKAHKLDENQFKNCLEAGSTHEAILYQASQGQKAQIRGTPAIFVNGRLMPRGQLIPVLEAAYQSLLNTK